MSLKDEEMVSYAHKDGPAHTRFTQFKKDPLPPWAVDVRPYVEPVRNTDIKSKQAYEWVKTGHWDLKQFQSWFEDHCHEHYSDGYDSGTFDANY